MPDKDLSVIPAQVSKFVMVGITSTAINYAIFYLLLNFLFVSYILSSAIGFLTGMAVGFRLNRDWTFHSRESGKQSYLKYLILYSFSLMTGLLFLRATVEVFSLSPEAANILTIGLTTIINFSGTKFWVFRV